MALQLCQNVGPQAACRHTAANQAAPFRSLIPLPQVAVVILSWRGADPTEHIELAHALRVARILRILRVRGGWGRGVYQLLKQH